MAFASVGLRAGLATLALRSTPQRTCVLSRSFSTRLNTSSLRLKVATPAYLSRRTYASKVPAEEPAAASSTAATTLPASESLPLDSATSESLNVADQIVQSIPPMAYGDLAALGLTSWSPIGLIAWGYELINVTTGLPWFWTIVLGSTLCRVVCVPFALTAIRSSARLRPIQGKIAKIQERVSHARATQDTLAMQKAGLEMKALYQEAKVNPVTGMLLPNFIQLPITIGMFFALKRMTQLPVPQLLDGGVGDWFWANNLTLADPYYILPVLFTGMINLQITVGGRDIDTTTSPAAGHMMNLFRGLSLLTVVFMSHFPSGLFVGLITTSALTTLQSLLLRSDAVRQMLNVPVIPKSQHGKIPSIMESVQYAKTQLRQANMQ